MERSLYTFIQELPKAELHVHIEGTLEPPLFFLIADRNGIRIPYNSPEAARTAYLSYHDLNSFLDIYFSVTQVLRTEQDFYDLTFSYLQKAITQGVLHVEIFFELQTYLQRGIKPEIVINGIYSALITAQREFGISGFLILSFLRNFSVESALKLLDLSLKFQDKIKGIGLASYEIGNPPSKFIPLFDQARLYGYHLTAHAGEVGGPETIYEAINLLHVERVDHGIHCWQDPKLVHELIKRTIPLTLCPLSNQKLGIYKDLKEYPLKQMLSAGLTVSLNSDDPAFFGGYTADNYRALQAALELSCKDLIQCAANSFRSSFLDKESKIFFLTKLQEYLQRYELK